MIGVLDYIIVTDRDEVSRARAIWWSTKDSGKALQELRNYHCIERKLLEGLNKHAKNDLVSALSWVRLVFLLLLEIDQVFC